MIELADVLEIHQVLVNEFGGVSGIRDEGLLRSALERPFGGSNETYFYPTVEEKAGAILESIVMNHPFVDGNKRTLEALTVPGFRVSIQAIFDKQANMEALQRIMINADR